MQSHGGQLSLAPRRHKEFYGGGLMIFIGLSAFLGGLQYRIGTLEHMGPGLFPAAVGALLALVGLAIAGSAPSGAASTGNLAAPEWRGWICLAASMIAFMILGIYGGLVPASFAIAFIAALGDRSNTLLHALALGTIMALIAAIVFRWGLQLQLPLFQWV